MTTTPNCPMCGNNRHVVASGQRLWYCAMHKMEFETGDDGDVTYGRPEKRLEREERLKETLKERGRR
jgi:ribosomal protein L37AE/L43A